MSKHKHRDEDPFREWRERQDHMYDPGYYLGGRIHPMYKAKRPNKFGGILILMGVVTMGYGIAGVRSGSGLVALVVGLLQIVAGSRMMDRGPKAKPRDGDRAG